jgi:hypothetical protein
MIIQKPPYRLYLLRRTRSQLACSEKPRHLRSLSHLELAARTLCANKSDRGFGALAIVVVLFSRQMPRSATVVNILGAKNVLETRTWNPTCRNLIAETIVLTIHRPKLQKYPDGYPGDAEPPAEPPARTWRKPRQRVRYTCHQCSTVYRSGQDICSSCGQEKGPETIRDP